MKTWKILVNGRVQKVGYRKLIDEIAYNLGINGYVRNVEDKKTVEIVAQHTKEEALKKFIELIKINEYPIKVENVNIQELEAQVYDDFQVIEGQLEVENRESLEAGTVYLRKLAGGMQELNTGMDKLNNEMKKTREELGEKIDDGFDKVSNKIDEGFGGTNKRFDTLDKKYGTVSKSLEEISKDLKEINGNIKSFKPKE